MNAPGDRYHPVCLIPARGGSKRFPRKNVAPLNGKPLLAYSVEAARQSGLFSDVWVSTEDAEIEELAKASGASVHARSDVLASDTATLVDVSIAFLDWREAQGRPADVLCLVLATAALLRPVDLRDAFAQFSAEHTEFLMAVTTFLESPLWALQSVDGRLRPFFGPEYLQPGSKPPELLVDAGYFYIVKADAFRRERTFYGSTLIGHVLPRSRCIDIDHPEHLRMVEALMQLSSNQTARVAASETR